MFKKRLRVVMLSILKESANRLLEPDYREDVWDEITEDDFISAVDDIDLFNSILTIFIYGMFADQVVDGLIFLALQNSEEIDYIDEIT